MNVQTVEEQKKPAFTLERPASGSDLVSFLTEMQRRRLRPATPEELRSFARAHPELAHAQPLIAVIARNGELRAAFCIWSQGDAVTLQTVTPENPFLLGHGWLHKCRVLAFPV